MTIKNQLLLKHFLFLFLFSFGISNLIFSQTDHFHYSKVFGGKKDYRIFLPDDYDNSGKRYPVIYYFHGNTGNHQFVWEGINELINTNSVILVAWNGRSVESDLRPYNIGNHSNINYKVQFKDYFLEFVNYIDSTYRTINDRSGRAVVGHSMGGIMSFFLAGKYPDMISAAVNFKGSPEFFIGYPENHSLYHVRHMFKNLQGVKLWFSNGSTCELTNLNTEVHNAALNEYGLDYEYHFYEGGHSVSRDEFLEAFNFIVSALKEPLDKPKRWHHSDLYSDFDIWGYEVRSNKSVPGFIELRGVTSGGFESLTKKWEPDGILIPGVEINLKTAPLYTPNSVYNLLDYNKTRDEKSVSKVKSDPDGRISLKLNHERHQIGISKKGGPAEIVFVDYIVDEKSMFLKHNEGCSLKIRLLNKGGSDARDLRLKLFSQAEGLAILNPLIKIDKIPAGELVWQEAAFNIIAENKPVVDGSPFRIRFNLEITDSKGQVWTDEFDIPVFYDVPEFVNIGIDDGDSEIFGVGNGNNIAEPGEYIMIYEISRESHRTRLYYDDPYIDDERLYDEIQPDKWGDGYTLSSIVRIADNCPPGHKINFLASYEIKDWMAIRRNVTWGRITITIGDNSGSD